jgi:glycosyltransferase involved in cell wall biosynthesis
MKILIIYQYFGTPAGFWSTRIYELSKVWLTKGHNVTVITSPYSKSDISASKLIEHQEIEGIKLIVINTPDDNKKSILKRMANSFFFSILSSIYAFKQKYDVVLASSGPITVALPALAKFFLSRTPFVFEMRDLWPHGGIEMGKIKNAVLIKLLYWFEDLIYSKARLIVTSSTGQADFIKGKLKTEKPLIVIPNGCDLKVFEESKNVALPAWVGERPYFLHIGSLGFIHDCTQIINAGIWLKENGYSEILNIIFIGEGADRVKLETSCLQYGLNFIYFIGLKPKNQLGSWLNHSVGTIFTTLNNRIQDTCSPNKIFDSFAAGKLIVQTSNGWIKDLVHVENCGINVEYNNPQNLGEAMVNLIQNPLECETKNRNAIFLAKNIFNRQKLANYYLENILKVIQSK